MKEVAVHEAETRLSEMLVEVEQGEQFTITRRGQPIACLTSATRASQEVASQRGWVDATRAVLREVRKGVVLEGSPRDSIADGRD